VLAIMIILLAVVGLVIVNALKSRVAELLTAAGKPPLVLTSSVVCGAERSAELFEAAYNDYRRRVKKVY